MGIGPDGDEFRRADGIGPCGIGHVDRIADRRQLAICSGLASARPSYVVYLFMHLACGIEASP
jgi:hypothetical protein